MDALASSRNPQPWLGAHPNIVAAATDVTIGAVINRKGEPQAQGERDAPCSVGLNIVLPYRVLVLTVAASSTADTSSEWR